MSESKMLSESEKLKTKFTCVKLRFTGVILRITCVKLRFHEPKANQKHPCMILGSEKGMVLIVVILMLAALIIIGTTVAMQTSTDVKVSGNYKTSMQAFYIAEAGTELMRAYLKNDANKDLPDHSWANTKFVFPAPAGTVTVPNNDNVNYYQIDIPESVRTLSVGGTTGVFSIELKNIKNPDDPDGPSLPDKIAVRSTGKIAGAEAAVEAVLIMKDYGPWKNAVFAGGGAAGATITGNADIRGSVNILGEGLTPTDFAIDMLGTAGIGNNYKDMSVTLKALIPPIGLPESLEAELRVKHGKVGLSGTAIVGKPEVADDYKDTVNGVYVTDGFGGTHGAANVYSDNGTSCAYDLGEDVKFPSLSDPYVDLETGTAYDTYKDYLAAKKTYTIEEDLIINKDTPDFIKGPLKWTQSSRTLEISELVEVKGNIIIQKASPSGPYNYKGKGTLYVSDPAKVATIENSFLPKEEDGGFPANAIGLICAGDMKIGKTAQIQTAGAFYAEGKIVSNKQNEILGTFVSNYFDMGGQVPKIYQVPSLAGNLPPHMPGSTPIYYVKVNSWREVR